MKQSELLAPPANADIEAAVLGAMLCEHDAVGTALTLLRAGSAVFYLPAHQQIFRAIQAVHDSSQAVDVLTVAEYLIKAKKLDEVGGPLGLGELTLKAASPAHLPAHCYLLLEYYTKREIALVSHRLRDQAYNPTQDPHELLADAQSSLNGLHDALQIRRPQLVGDLFHPVVDGIVAATQTPGGVTGVPSGLPSLDAVTGGWQPGNLIIIAARPGMGKTSLALAMARMATPTHPGFFATLEMSSSELVRKLIATELRYTTSQLTRGANMCSEEAESIRVRAHRLQSLNLVFDDSAGLTVGELRAKVAKAKSEHHITFVVVDYLQLMRGDAKAIREQEISSISRGLKLLAKEFNIPVLALAQLSRAVEARGGDKKPQLSDLRESGAIEQDADLILFPYRPEYYGIDRDSDGQPTADTTELIVAKHRNGRLANIVVQSVMRYGHYGELDGTMGS